MENTSFHIIFEVLKIEHKLEEDSTIQVGERFVGLYHPDNKEIHFTDENGQEWIFYDGNSYRIIDKF